MMIELLCVFVDLNEKNNEQLLSVVYTPNHTIPPNTFTSVENAPQIKDKIPIYLLLQLRYNVIQKIIIFDQDSYIYLSG